MVYQISRRVINELPYDLEGEIRKFAQEVRAWNNQEEMVKKTSNNKDPIDRYSSYPHPTAIPLITQAVDEDGNVNFEIIEDTDDPQILLDQKKDALQIELSNLEIEERNKVVPSRKLRLFNLHIDRIKASDKFDKDTKEMLPRTKEDQDFMDAVDQRKEIMNKIDWWAAEQSAKIADLTLETIDTWKISPFDGN